MQAAESAERRWRLTHVRDNGPRPRLDFRAKETNRDPIDGGRGCDVVLRVTASLGGEPENETVRLVICADRSGHNTETAAAGARGLTEMYEDCKLGLGG